MIKQCAQPGCSDRFETAGPDVLCMTHGAHREDGLRPPCAHHACGVILMDVPMSQYGSAMCSEHAE